jgi:hypothetical protein
LQRRRRLRATDRGHFHGARGHDPRGAGRLRKKPTQGLIQSHPARQRLTPVAGAGRSANQRDIGLLGQIEQRFAIGLRADFKADRRRAGVTAAD